MSVPECHPERKHKARGLCAGCYHQALRDAHPEKRRAWYAANREREQKKARDRWAATPPGKRRSQSRAVAIRFRYGMEPHQVEAMLVAQGGLCAICGQSFPSSPEIDHDHATGKVRGLLCRRCNSLLAAFDHPDWLSRAETYLEKHKEVAA